MMLLNKQILVVALLAVCFQFATAQKVVVEHLSTYFAGAFDQGAAEIVAHDPATQRIFFVNASTSTIDVLDVKNAKNPTLIKKIDLTPYGDQANSIDVANGILAAAVQAEDVVANGKVVFFDTDGNFLKSVDCGVLPDMLTFAFNGTRVLVANEGQPSNDYTSDPEGSVTVVDLANGVTNATATQITFTAFNSRKASLQNRGIRIFGPNASVAQDLEPEYIAVAEEKNLAYVTCQENNALAVINLTTNAVIDILPLGYKDHSKGAPKLQEFFLNELPNWPTIGTPVFEGALPVKLGGFSGLYFDAKESTEDAYVLYAMPDRGPNGAAIPARTANAVNDLRTFKLPNYQGRIVKITYNPKRGTVSFDEKDQIFLTRQDGTTPISGRGNIKGYDEVPVTFTDPTVYTEATYTVDGVSYAELPYDELGGDFEGIFRDNDGNFWMCDEYRPAIYKFAPNGTLIERFVAEGTSALGVTPQPVGTYGKETLPAVYAKRWANRGFEAIAFDAEKELVYAFIQSPIDNPNSSIRNSDVLRILAVNLDGEPVAEYVYLLERNRNAGVGISRVDKIGDAVYVGNGRFMVLERDSSVPGDGNIGKKYIFEVDLKGATNILGTALSTKTTSTGTTDKTLEMMTADDLAAAGIRAVFKNKVLNLPSIGYLPTDKPEGLTLLPGGALAVISDNDFGLGGEGFTDASDLGIITFSGNYAFDASDRDTDIEIWNRPTLGMFMPDAIKSYSSNGKTYIVSANEGDARAYGGFSEETRVGGLNLDAADFPNASILKNNNNLGRLLSTKATGDIDGDGDFDRIYSYGARSFSIWDEAGNLVFDSGNDFEKYIAQLDPAHFNSNHTSNNSRKARSDDKGPEPEAIEIATIDGRTMAFIGLERMGGFMLYDITNPLSPTFEGYVNNRNFDANAQTPEAGDLGVEDIIFIKAEDSPTGNMMLVTGNEVSGTVSLFEAYKPSERFTLQVLHNNDGESQLLGAEGNSNIGGVHRFKSVVDSLRYTSWLKRYAGSLMLSSGDNFLAGPEFNANLALPADAPLYDAIAINAIGYDALAIGNHDFDFGPEILQRLIEDTGTATVPAFLSANLAFEGEPGLQALVDAGKIAPAKILFRGSEKIGVIGLTTPAIPFISSPRNVEVSDDLAFIVQLWVDVFTAQGVNKIILISHLQSIEEEIALAAQVSGVDIIIAGGGDELLTNNAANAIDGLEIFSPYPYKVADAFGDTTYIVTTPGEYRFVGQLVATFDQAGKVTRLGEESDVVLVKTNRPNAQLVNQVINPVQAYVNGLAATVVATTEVALDGLRNSIRTKETNEGNLIADAMLWQARKLADQFNVTAPMVALQNGGGIRNNNVIAAGSEVTELTVFSMLPFANFLSVVEVPASQFKALLENAVSRVEFVDGRFAQVAGFKFVYNPALAAGSRIVSATLNDGTPIVANGTVVNGAPNISIATIDFLARGGDEYPYNGAAFTNLGLTYQQTLSNYIVEALEGRITAAQYPEGGEGRITTVTNAAALAVNNAVEGVSAYPNPFTERFTLTYAVEVADQVTVSLVNGAGEVVATLFSGNQETGTYTIDADAKTYGLTDQAYFVAIQRGATVTIMPVVKQ